MRPVERGINTKVYLKYEQARGLLIERLGEYCSYCEMHLDADLAVEHVQPKDPKKGNPTLALEWTNFLLACRNCNSHKKDKPVVLDDFFWVDRDSTTRAFIYSANGLISVNPSLSLEQQAQAERTIKLVGLDARPPIHSDASDRRWNNRRLAWDAAQRSLKRLMSFDSPEMREEIVEHATERGYWSVWMTVFKDDPDMLERFINAFAGTTKSCFDPVTFQPVPRVGGAI